MATLQSAVHTGPMTELLNVALRAIGVVLPAAGVLGLVELRGGGPDGDFGTFFGAMGLSMLAAAVWSAIDARRAPISKVLTRWVATAFVVGGGLGLATTLMAPGSPPSPERTAEAVSMALFYAVPLLMAAGLGVGFAAPTSGCRNPTKVRRRDGMGHEIAVRNVVTSADATLPLRLFRRLPIAVPVVLLVLVALRLAGDLDYLGALGSLLGVTVPTWAVLLLVFGFLLGRVWDRRTTRKSRTQADTDRIRALGLLLRAGSSRSRAGRSN
jgi:hypothetical protein